MDIWPWICKIPQSEETRSPLFYVLATSKPGVHNSATHSLRLIVKRNHDPTCVSFLVCLNKLDSESNEENKILWESDACHLSDETPFTITFITQLLEETISRAPTQADRATVIPRSRLHELLTRTISQILSSHFSNSFSSFFNLVFLAHLFWICACDAPTEVGSLYFNELLTPNLADFDHALVLRSFLMHVGVDAELRFMRSLGYMFSKWLILKEMGVGLQVLLTSKKNQRLRFSYATEAHGLWVLKGYTPVLSMERTSVVDGGNNAIHKQSILKYALAHQQLEAVIQMEYSVKMLDNYIEVKARVDNLRLDVAKLVFNDASDKNDGSPEEDGEDYVNEKHSPSRIRVWLGPELGSDYVSGLSLTRSTDTVDKHKLKQKIDGEVIAKAKTGRRRKWRWDQYAEGNAAVFEAVLCNGINGNELGTWKVWSTEDGSVDKTKNGSRRRQVVENRSLAKSGSVVMAMDEFGDEVKWRLDKEVRGSVLKWRLAAQVWMTYWPTNVKTMYGETRRVEWCDEVDLSVDHVN